jgi:hypothetical protein
MYSWGNDTSTWKNPQRYNYDPARRAYLDQNAATAKPRTYSRRTDPDMSFVSPLNKIIETQSEHPLIVGIDVTGSMAHWPAEIFDRLPLLYQTLSQYKPDLEISFCAIGDANSDNFPLQVNNFGKGPALDDHIRALAAEGGGGGQSKETYELFGHFMNTHVRMPNARLPFLIMFGDEGFYEKIRPDQVSALIGDKIESELESRTMWYELSKKFNMYMLRKPYQNSAEDNIRQQWESVLGAEKVIQLPSAERAVDIAMGIIAKHYGQFGDFTQSMSARQDPATVNAVMQSLRYVPDAGSTRSQIIGAQASKKSKLLTP